MHKHQSSRSRPRRLSRLATLFGAIALCGSLAVPFVRGDVVFTRSTANGEGWATYSASYTPSQSGSYRLGFNLTAFPGRDSTIFLDEVRVTSGATTLFQSGFENPAIGAGTFHYPTGPSIGTATAAEWTYSNYSGLINGSPFLWGLAAYAGSQRGFVQAYSGTLSSITSANTISLVAGQTYTVAFAQASRGGTVGDEGTVTYTVTLDYVPPPAPAIDFAMPQRTDWGVGKISFGHIFSSTGLPDVLSSRDGNSNVATAYRNNGNGTFTSNGTFSVVAQGNVEQTVLADLNGDGFSDIVAISRSGLFTLLNNGSGGFTFTGQYYWNDSNYFPSDFQGIKVDAAVTHAGGFVDVIATGAGGSGRNRVLLFRGNGDGTLQPNPTSLSTGHDYATPIKFAAVDGSGYPAIVVMGVWGNSLQVWGNTNGNFTKTYQLEANDQNYFLSSAQFIDMDQDGTLDLVVATGDGSHGWTGNIYWYKGLGGATFGSTRNTAFTGQAQRWNGSTWSSDWFYDSLTAADIDRDGQVDLIGTAQNGRPAILRNNGDGTFAKAWESSPVDTLGRVAFAAFTYYVDVTGTGSSLIGANGPTNAFQTFSSFGEYYGPMLNATPVDTTPPIISVPADITKEATSANGAVVTFTATAVDDVDGPVSVVATPASGSTFALGETIVGLAATDAAGNDASASFKVTVVDTTAPVIASVTPSIATLWPPNHQMVAVSLNVVASDAVGCTLRIKGVTSSEPDNGLGDGDTPNDIQFSGADGDLTVNLRAERSGTGNGRTYTITVEARDAAGNASTKTCTVLVPKSRAGK